MELECQSRLSKRLLRERGIFSLFETLALARLHDPHGGWLDALRTLELAAQVRIMVAPVVGLGVHVHRPVASGERAEELVTVHNPASSPKEDA